MHEPIINRKVLMSGAKYFRVEELNPYSNHNHQPDVDLAIKEHETVKNSLIQGGISVVSVDPPSGCQDGIYTANWALCWKGKAVLSSLPNRRQAEEPFARETLKSMGYEPIKPPHRFSGQGDALPVSNYLFVGSSYRTDRAMHQFLADVFDCEVVGIQTIPQLDANNQPVINAITGWPDSYFYDLDLAISVITPDLIAWCPEALDEPSREKLSALPLDKIEVSLQEAKNGFACNLVSSGETVIMSDKAPRLKQQLESRGFKTIAPHITELNKGGGYIRCCSLTLD